MEENIVSVVDNNNEKIDVEIFTEDNEINLEFSTNFESAISVHNSEKSSHPYLLEKLSQKIDIIEGKGLSTNDFTDELKSTYDNYSTIIINSSNDIKGEIGNLKELKTTGKTDLVSAINEVSASSNNIVGNLEKLETFNKSNIVNSINEISNKVSDSSTVFAINSCHINSTGQNDLMFANGNNIDFNCNAEFPLIATSANSKQFKREFLTPLDVSELTDGNYNIFVGADNQPYNLANTVYIQCSTPTGTENSIWLDTSVEPLKAKKYNGSEWEQFDDVWLGSTTIKNGIVQSVINNPLNFNGVGRKLIEAYKNGTSWYNLFLQYNPTTHILAQWCEQGSSTVVNITNTIVTLLKPFEDTNYSVLALGQIFTNAGYYQCFVGEGDASHFGTSGRTKSSFILSTSNFNNGKATWLACGFAK